METGWETSTIDVLASDAVATRVATTRLAYTLVCLLSSRSVEQTSGLKVTDAWGGRVSEGTMSPRETREPLRHEQSHSGTRLHRSSARGAGISSLTS